MSTHPTSKPAVIYNQDDLSDFVTNGGSIASIFADEIKEGRRIIVVQQSKGAPEEVLAVIESEDDLKRLREAHQKMNKWLEKAVSGK